jgi:hypothetical protein
MLLERRFAASVAVIAALACGAPAASAGPATIPVTPRPFIAPLAFGFPLPSTAAAATPVPAQAKGSPSCPDWYQGPTNLATGCPYWLMS